MAMRGRQNRITSDHGIFVMIDHERGVGLFTFQPENAVTRCWNIGAEFLLRVECSSVASC